MKHTSMAIAMVAMLAITACSKKQSPQAVSEEPVTAIGFWEGKIGAGTTMGLYYGVLLHKNGTMRAYQGGSDSASALKADGTWQINGNSIKLTYKMASAASNTICSALSNSNFTSMNGDYEVGMVKGKFALSK